MIVWKDFCEPANKVVKALIVGNVNSIFQTNLSSQLRRATPDSLVSVSSKPGVRL